VANKEKPPNVSFFGGPMKKTTESNHVFGGPKKPPKISVFWATKLQTAKNNRGRQKMVFYL
jgi:hypothetical protein